MDIIDITRKIREGMPVYPGNPEPEIEKYREIPEDSTTESEISMGSHTGTHVDAPQHVFEDGETVDQMDLEKFYGKCQVLDLTSAGREINREILQQKNITEDIILLKTENSEKNFEEFREDFAYLTLSGVEYLIENGVETVGIDYLSLVEFDGGEEAEEAHQKANEKMAVIEGLELSSAEEKNYTFSGMPLKMETDGVQLRAVLIEE